jgi:alpha-methylacyl-CoA racemase
MMLADLGADVIRIVRPDDDAATGTFTMRGRSIARADLKVAAQLSAVQSLIELADVLIEGYRPGVTERLGLGPQECLRRNPRLIYARMTGWGQDGPRASTAGHDINYLSLTGALHAIGPASSPVPPLNLVGDYGGGSMFLITGILAALYEREHSGTGQVLDVAMVDGVSALLQPVREMRARGLWNDERANNMLDGAAPYYRTYACSDGEFVAVGAIEPQFYEKLLAGLELPMLSSFDQNDRAQWPVIAERIAEIFRSRPRRDWLAKFAGTDACVTPVLTFAEAATDSHLVARATLTAGPDGAEAAPAPRFSRTASTGSSHAQAHVVSVSAAVDSWAAR